MRIKDTAHTFIHTCLAHVYISLWPFTILVSHLEMLGFWFFLFQKSAQACLLLAFFSMLPNLLSLTQEMYSWNYSLRSYQQPLLPFPIIINWYQ